MTDVAGLIKRVQEVGQKLTSAQPKELAVGNIVRRVLRVIRDEAEENRDADSSETGTESSRAPREGLQSQQHALSSSSSMSSPLRHGALSPQDLSIHDKLIQNLEEDDLYQPRALVSSQPLLAAVTSQPLLKSVFSLLSLPTSSVPSPTATPGTQSPRCESPNQLEALKDSDAAKDLRAEVVEAIEEIIEELSTADDQISSHALDHIHSNEVILTHTSSVTVQKFLLKAAGKRKFTVIFAESFPNEHENVYATVTGNLKGNSSGAGPDRFHKSLTAAGITVILVPDSAVFALMPRVNKVILGTHAVLANGGLIAAAGSRTIAKAASMHKTPVVVLSAVYKISPTYPFCTDSLIEFGNSSNILSNQDLDLIENVEVDNPLYDYVPSDLIDLYITSL